MRGSCAAASQFLLTPLREGRQACSVGAQLRLNFYSRPCGRGDSGGFAHRLQITLHFYSRPCGRGDRTIVVYLLQLITFLLTPLREGRRGRSPVGAGGGKFLLTPLREGRPGAAVLREGAWTHFYSRPCGRGDSNFPQVRHEVLRQIAER